jgi:hypothetical protein
MFRMIVRADSDNFPKQYYGLVFVLSLRYEPNVQIFRRISGLKGLRAIYIIGIYTELVSPFRPQTSSHLLLGLPGPRLPLSPAIQSLRITRNSFLLEQITNLLQHPISWSTRVSFP